MQTVIAEREIRGHAADSLVALNNSTAERNSQEIALQVVVPLMIDAREMGCIALGATADSGAAVSALVDEGV